MARAPKWKLLDSPDSPVYEEVLSRAREGDRDLFRATCENDFWFFVRHCLTLGQVRCGDPHLTEWYGRPWFDHPWLFEYCREIQEDPDGNLTLKPRFHFKTALETQSYPLWELLKNPDLRFLIITYKIEKVGDSFLGHIKREAEINELLPATWPHVFWERPQTQAPEWSMTALCFPRSLNPKEPTFAVTSLKTGATSTHVDRRIWDDIVTQDAVRSRMAIDDTTELWRKFAGTAADHTVDRYVGTHWAVNDTYRYILDLGAAKLRYGDVYEEDGVTPVLRSKEWVDKIRLQLGSYNFNAQLRNMPVAASLQTFDLGWIRHYDEDRDEIAKKLNVYIFIDTARSEKGNDPDYTAISTVGLGRGVPHGNYYGLDLCRDRMGLVRLTEQLFDLVERWKPLCVYIEQVGGMRDIEHIKHEMVRQGFSFRIKDIQERLKKEDRIQRLQPIMEAGRFYLPRGGIIGQMDGRKVDFIQVLKAEELMDWNPIHGAPQHDDMLDSLAWIASPAVKLRFPEKYGQGVGAAEPGAWQRRDNAPTEPNPWAL